LKVEEIPAVASVTMRKLLDRNTYSGEDCLFLV